VYDIEGVGVSAPKPGDERELRVPVHDDLLHSSLVLRPSG
jgi:hypothetical protein